MTIRERLEQEEAQRLSPRAVCAKDTRGREKPIDPCPMRTDFQRDRDRIIHCKAFRRLKYKTQVFLAPEGDHYRTRLTHTLEVAQIARTLARCLQLNEDLTEAIALGHDLGHTPFGHIGEHALDRLMPEGFRHNEQSRRCVEALENDGNGLNLTWEVRDGILCHSGKQFPATLEGQCVRRADRIAYLNHDLDDALRAGVLQPFELPADCLKVLGQTHGERINTMIWSMLEGSVQGDVGMTPPVLEAYETLHAFLFERVYFNPVAKAEEGKAKQAIGALFEHFMQKPQELPQEYQNYMEQDGLERVVLDYISGMTDRYCIARFEEIFVPKVWR